MYISGIQQIGIGVPDETAAFEWYKEVFGMDVRMFQEAAEAPLMTPYTGGVVQSRSATLSINMRGGGGFEIWQYTSRNTEKAEFDVKLGDYGLFVCKINCANVNEGYRRHKEAGYNLLCEIQADPAGVPFYLIKDPFGNIFQVIETGYQFSKTKSPFGGVYGAMIGVSDIKKSMDFYEKALGFDQVLYDSPIIDDVLALPGAKGHSFRRVLLGRSKPFEGAFAPLLGPSTIELVERLDVGASSQPMHPIFQDRFWGDAGFIHLCFDVRQMGKLKNICETAGYKFTVDSNDTFDMGQASGRFAYVEDPDGTLIEFVEVHKVPILKKWGLFMNLKNRPAGKPLPRLMLKALAFNRVK